MAGDQKQNKREEDRQPAKFRRDQLVQFKQNTAVFLRGKVPSVGQKKNQRGADENKTDNIKDRLLVDFEL